MKKLLLTAACALFAGSLNAAGFSLNGASLVDQLTVSAPEVKIPEAPRPARAKAGRYVQVSGYVNLNGNGWMPSGDNGGFTSVNLTGWASFRDATGQVVSNNAYINTSVSLWVRPGQHVFQTVWPNVYAQFTYKGKPCGSANMNGSISVSGWPSSSFFSLSGSGYLTGSVYVEDME